MRTAAAKSSPDPPDPGEAAAGEAGNGSGRRIRGEGDRRRGRALDERQRGALLPAGEKVRASEVSDGRRREREEAGTRSSSVGR